MVAVRIGYLIDTHLRSAAPPSAGERRAAMEAMIEEGVAAERAGFHSVMAPERHGNRECHFPGCEQLLTVLARETERVALGTFTHVATLTHPLKAAEQFATIDNLSGGRLITTVSRGFLPPFWGQFGVPRERMLGRFLEALRIWRAAFAGDRFDFDGDHWRVEGGLLAPPPFQDGGWPLWGGGNTAPAAIRRCAEYAESWTCDPLPVHPDVWRANRRLYAERARELGKRPFVVLMRDGWVADTLAEAKATFAEHFARQARFYRAAGLLQHHPDFADAAAITADAVAPHLIVGSPRECVERLERLHEELGVDYVVLCCRLSTGPSLAATREQIARLGEEVVAPIHRRYPAPDHPAIPVACRW